MKILVVSSSRADWGLLAPVVQELRVCKVFDVHLALTGQHLVLGSNSDELLRAEGTVVDHTIDMGLNGDDGVAALGKAMGAAVSGTAALLETIRPDLLVVLGDRYEILCVVAAAVVAQVPVAHLCGGDVTEGAMDDSIRHAITKLSSLHFVSNADSARRVAQLGEPADRIFTVGSTGLDRVVGCPVMERAALLEEVGLRTCENFFVVTYHPATLSDDTLAECRAMLAALDRFPEYGLLFTGSNVDPGARAIEMEVRQFAARRDNAVFHETLGSRRFFSALTYAAAVIGNSSSGLYEAPSFKLPTVNIGNRQKGRLRAESVIDCTGDMKNIAAAIRRALEMDCSSATNPYGDGKSAPRIVNVLKNLAKPSRLLRKSFVTL